MTPWPNKSPNKDTPGDDLHFIKEGYGCVN